MVTSTVKCGDSFSIWLKLKSGQVFPVSTNMLVYIGGVLIGNKDTQSPPIIYEDSYYKMFLSSSETFLMRGYRDLIIVLDGSGGVKQTIAAGILFERLPTDYQSPTENNGYNMLVEIDISTDTIITDVTLQDALKGDKGEPGKDGVDGENGAGTIASIIAGDNILIDDTDVNNPIISAVIPIIDGSRWGDSGLTQITPKYSKHIPASIIDDLPTAVTTENIMSMFTLGGIASQEVITSGTTFNQFVKDLLTSVFYPTFVLPTSSLASSSIVGVNGAAYEAGSTNTLTLIATFNRGSILGKLVGGIWQPATQQDYRAGIVNKYTIDGVDNGTSNTRTLVSKILANGSNSFTSQIDFDEGPQPTDSTGANYNGKYPAGSQTSSTSITAYYPQWYGVSVNSSIDTYGECSGLTKSISSGTAFSSTFSPSYQYVYFITRNLNGEIKDGNLFSQTISALNIEDGVSEFYKKSFIITLLNGTTTTLYSYRTRNVKTLTSYTYSIT